LDLAGSYFDDFGSRAGLRGRGYYHYDLGADHIYERFARLGGSAVRTAVT